MINNSNILSIITIIISIVAVIVSVVALVLNNNNSKKSLEKNLNKEFFEKVFFEEIIYNLPNSLNDFKNTDTIIENILEKAKFYKYFDSKFYENVKRILTEIDENLVLIKDPNIKEEEFDRRKNEIKILIENFYSILKKYYSYI